MFPSFFRCKICYFLEGAIYLFWILFWTLLDGFGSNLASKTLQEAFQLRSTVAVLGFSLRTMAQLLEQGALDEVVSQQRRSGGNRPPRGERRSDGDGRNERGSRPNPFARPSKPVAEPEPEAEVEATATAETSDEAAAEASTDATTAEATSEN